jgi:hypothetical protein
MASVAPIHSPASVGPIREVSSEDVKYTVGPLKDLVEWMASGAELPPTEANREDVRRAQELLQKWEEVNREDVNTIVVAPKKKNPRLNQLTGMRALASLWIAVGHYSPPGSLYPFGTILSRSWVAVSFFIFLSGFVTHYAYYNKSYKQWNEFRQFYFRRIGRVLASYYISYGCVAIVFLVLSSTGTIDPDKDPRNWYMYVLVSSLFPRFCFVMHNFLSSSCVKYLRLQPSVVSPFTMISSLFLPFFHDFLPLSRRSLSLPPSLFILLYFTPSPLLSFLITTNTTTTHNQLVIASFSDFPLLS